MVEFEVISLLERRDRLLFDYDLYMGLDIGLLFSGVQESIKTMGELRRRNNTSWYRMASYLKPISY